MKSKTNASDDEELAVTVTPFAPIACVLFSAVWIAEADGGQEMSDVISTNALPWVHVVGVVPVAVKTFPVKFVPPMLVKSSPALNVEMR